MKNTEKSSKAKLAARILAIILAVLMVVGMAYYTIYMLILEAQEDDDTEKSAEAIEVVLPDTL
ncbi:MAG: hypothetical protein E7644_05880 [Ruminococcaceae bacterium]|nr:hypothetical protein [Oscillospiraceae bacterium]